MSWVKYFWTKLFWMYSSRPFRKGMTLVGAFFFDLGSLQGHGVVGGCFFKYIAPFSNYRCDHIFPLRNTHSPTDGTLKCSFVQFDSVSFKFSGNADSNNIIRALPYLLDIFFSAVSMSRHIRPLCSSWCSQCLPLAWTFGIFLCNKISTFSSLPISVVSFRMPHTMIFWYATIPIHFETLNSTCPDEAPTLS